MVRRGSAAMVAGLLLAAAAFFGGDVVRAESSVSPPVAATPEDAVRLSVEATSEVFAGMCVDTVSPRDLGKTCARFVGERGEVRAYLTGRTFSEFSRWVFVMRTEGGWQPAGSVVLDFFAQPDIPWPAALDASHA